MRFWTTIGLILVLSVVGLTYEIAAGRVLAPFFGTSLVTWTAVIATVLAGFALGNALGGLVAERERDAALRTVRHALVATAILMALSPSILGLLYALGARETGGMVLTVVVAFFPASVLVSFPSPLLAKLAVEARPGREGSSLGLVLAAGSLGAIAGAVLAGFVALPLAGSAATFAACGAGALACVPLLRARPGPPPDSGMTGRGRTAAQDGATRPADRGDDPTARPGSLRTLWPAWAIVLGSLAVGPVCRYESGLSCIDVVQFGSAIQLQSDRIPQASERAVSDPADVAGPPTLVLSYTRVIWDRMARDLGPDPAVLFIGGGGYTLPTRLLAERPGARATAVEIDPLITQVVETHLPRAGAMIARTGFDATRGSAPADAGRLGIVHEDGRVFLNETRDRFDAVVMDAFSSGSVPAHLATIETYERVRAIAAGPVYVNLIDLPDGGLVRGVHAILSALYPHVRAVEGPPSARGRVNVVLAASPQPLEPLAQLPSGYRAVAVSPARPFTDDRGWVGHR